MDAVLAGDLLDLLKQIDILTRALGDHPGMRATDMGDLFCKSVEQAALDRLDGSSGPSGPPIGGHPPYRTHDL